MNKSIYLLFQCHSLLHNLYYNYIITVLTTGEEAELSVILNHTGHVFHSLCSCIGTAK